jgi:hypothetical protein
MIAGERSRRRAMSGAARRSFGGIALPFVLLLYGGSTAWAQAPLVPTRDVEAVLMPGRTVWITESAGIEEKMIAEVQRVRIRESDPLWNGALIGAGAAVASGLLLCRATEPWENCRDDIGPMLRIGALGAGIGIGIDALIRRRETVYEAAPGSTRIEASPLLGRRMAGVQLSLGF